MLERLGSGGLYARRPADLNCPYGNEALRRRHRAANPES
jgi:hypothetical protein